MALPLVSAGGQFLCSFTLSCVKRGNSQSTRPRAGDEIRVGILAAKPEADGRAEREYQLRRAANLCPTFPEIDLFQFASDKEIVRGSGNPSASLRLHGRGKPPAMALVLSSDFPSL